MIASTIFPSLWQGTRWLQCWSLRWRSRIAWFPFLLLNINARKRPKTAGKIRDENTAIATKHRMAHLRSRSILQPVFFSVQISIRDTDTCDIRDAFTIKSRLRCQLTEKCSPVKVIGSLPAVFFYLWRDAHCAIRRLFSDTFPNGAAGAVRWISIRRRFVGRRWLMALCWTRFTYEVELAVAASPWRSRPIRTPSTLGGDGVKKKISFLSGPNAWGRRNTKRMFHWTTSDWLSVGRFFLKFPARPVACCTDHDVFDPPPHPPSDLIFGFFYPPPPSPFFW